MTTQAFGTGTVILHDHQQRKHTIQDVVYVPKAEFPILSMFKLQLDISFSNDAIHFSNRRNGFSLQSAIRSDDILWISEGSNPQRTNVTMRSQTRKSPSNIDESIQAAPQIESSHQDLSIENSESMEIDEETSEYEATRFLAMLQAEDENFTPESSQYLNDWSATPAQDQEIFPTVHSENWHHRLGHVSASSISRIPTISTSFDTTTCESCILAKQHKLPFKSRQELEISEKLQLVHSDLCGPLPPSIDGSTYFITFTDDYSRYSWVYGIPNKKSSTIKVKFDEWIKDAHTKADKKVKYLRTDGGGEYTGFLIPLLSSYGITHQPTAPYTPQSNGISERLNRTLNDMVRTMLIHSHLPQSFWSEALQHAAYMKNRLPHSATYYNTPFSLYHD